MEDGTVDKILKAFTTQRSFPAIVHMTLKLNKTVEIQYVPNLAQDGNIYVNCSSCSEEQIEMFVDG